MTNRITCLVIDDRRNKEVYDEIQSDFINKNSERGFEFILLRDTSNIEEVLSNNRGVDVIISVGADIDVENLNTLPFKYRMRWVHFDSFSNDSIKNAIISTFLRNIDREMPNEVKLFSIFTPVFNTPRESLDRLYKSLKKQIYNEWDWWILDDSTDDSTNEYIQSYNDPRIHIIKNVSNHGSIGYNKHLISMCCDGDYLVEVDHDDELTEDCLLLIKRAFDTYPDTDFVYSDCLEIVGDNEIIYPEGFSLGQGQYRIENVNGVERTICITTPSINAKSIRMIYAEPNHVRCWKKTFYHKINGHCVGLSVLDDMELIIRTFLNGKMCHIPKTLYIQHEDGDRGGNGTNTQSKRFSEIQRTNYLLYWKYDNIIHNRILELGYDDTVWTENGHSDLNIDGVDLPEMNYTLDNVYYGKTSDTFEENLETQIEEYYIKNN